MPIIQLPDGRWVGTGLNKPKRTPDHPTKKGIVAVKDGEKIKIHQI